MLWLALAAALSHQPTPELRFHHFHVAVADQAAAMAFAAERLAASRLILQGHGPGVRSERQYLVFEFEEGTDGAGNSTAAVPLSPSESYAAAVAWMREQQLSAASEDFKSLPIERGLGAGRVTIVAFSSSAPALVIERLRARGIEPFESRFDIARYRVAPGLAIEITTETDRPDTHWCPMHPGVRSAGAAVCAICNMDLVPIPPPRVGEYPLDVAIQPVANRRGVFVLTLVVRDPEKNDVVSKFLDVHERRFHLFVISRNLASFAHLHPEQRPTGEFVLEHALESGEYVLLGDFLPAGGTPQMVHRAIVTPGYSGELFAAAPTLTAGATEQIVDGLRVTLDAKNIRALRPTSLRFLVTEAATGAPVRDLEPYLGAAGHLLLVNSDLTTAIHAHPEGPSSHGPELVFDPVLPRAGPVKMWLQFQRQGQVFTVSFIVEVAPL